MLTVCWLYVDCMLTVCCLYVDCMLTVCWLYVDCVSQDRFGCTLLARSSENAWPLPHSPLPACSSGAALALPRKPFIFWNRRWNFALLVSVLCNGSIWNRLLSSCFWFGIAYTLVTVALDMVMQRSWFEKQASCDTVRSQEDACCGLCNIRFV